MAASTTEYAVRRNPEMGPGGTPVPSPTEPFDAPEPELGSETMLVNVGPQHPATHGVLRLVVELDGETVVSVVPPEKPSNGARVTSRITRLNPSGSAARSR